MVAEPTVQVLTDGWGEKLLIEAIIKSMLESITKDLSLGREMNGHFLEGDWEES